jgi:hypothetical protein
MTKKQKQRNEECRKRFAQIVADFNQKNLPNPDEKRETFAERLQRIGKPMTNGEYLLQLASNPTEENLQRLKEAVEDAQTYYRNLKKSEEFQKCLEQVDPLPVKEFRKRLEKARQARSILQVEELTPESEYQRHLEYVRCMYEDYAQKDLETMSANEREQYRVRMDCIRWDRVALESDRPVEEKLIELKLRLGYHP